MELGWTRSPKVERQIAEPAACGDPAEMHGQAHAELPGGWWLLPGVVMGIALWAVIVIKLINPAVMALIES